MCQQGLDPLKNRLEFLLILFTWPGIKSLGINKTILVETRQRALVRWTCVLTIKEGFLPVLRMIVELHGYSPIFERQPSAALCLLVAIEELREKGNGGSPLQIYFTEYSEVADIQNGIWSQILGV